MEIFTEIVGYLAAVVGTGLMLPQLIKMIRTKKVADISLGMLFMYFLNCLLWLSYGILIMVWPVIICNFIALIISIIQIVLKYKYQNPAK